MKALNDIPWHSNLAILLRMDRHPMRPTDLSSAAAAVRQSPNLRFLPNRSDALAPRSIDGHDVLVRAPPAFHGSHSRLLEPEKTQPKAFVP